MLRDRYEPMHVFALVPPWSMALAPVLPHLDRVRDDDPLFQAGTVDRARRRPRPRPDGRPSTPVEVMLRMLVGKHL
jgi:IS5 family transposase